MEESGNNHNFMWNIENLSKPGDINAAKLCSDHFSAGGSKWRITAHEVEDSLAILLQVADSKRLADGRSIEAKFSVYVINENNSTDDIKREACYSFSKGHNCCGFDPFMLIVELRDPWVGYLVNDIFTVRVKVSFPVEQLKRVAAYDKTDIVAGKNSSSFAEFDALFSDIKSLLEPSIYEEKSSGNFSGKDITEAKEIFYQCLRMDIGSVIQSGKVPEFKNSLSLLLTTDAFPDDVAEMTRKIVAAFVNYCKEYEIAQRDLNEARENDNSVIELKSTLKRLSFEFTPVRSLAEAVDQEIARLEKQISLRQAQKVELKRKLEDLNVRAMASKEALVYAEEKTESFMLKRELAQTTIKDIEQLWDFFKVTHYYVAD